MRQANRRGFKRSKRLAVAVLALSSMLLGGMAAPSQEGDGDSATPLVGAGDLVVKGKLPIPVRQTDTRIRITGSVASVEVEQFFINPYAERIEAIYVFPLPSDAAVHDMEIQIGTRTIRSVVKRREEAKEIYEQAKQAGQRTALLEQERPNIFTASVANIDPGDEIRVRIHYQQHLAYDGGGYRLRFPMVVAPRYIPGIPTDWQDEGETPDTTQVPDASRITPPVLPPEVRPGHNVTVSVEIDGGLPVQDVRSVSHPISVHGIGTAAVQVELARRDEIPNKDFVLDYKLAGGSLDGAILTAAAKDGKGYFQLMVMPPASYLDAAVYPKEVTFILDTSGSMSGVKFEQARNALRALVHGLNPGDSFNIIRFSSEYSTFSPSPVPFTQASVDSADRFIDTLQSGGGTEILAPVKYALKQAHSKRRIPIIALLTDGQVGNEAEVLKAIKEHLGGTRFFTFGIGTALNDHLLRKAAELGRGTAELVSPHEDLEEVIARFQNRISAPVLTNVTLDWESLPVEEIFPSPLPDVYLARPLVLHGRMAQPVSGRVTLRGQTPAGPFALPLWLDFKLPIADGETLGRLWARKRIDALGDLLYEDPQDAKVKEAITALGLEHKLMTAYTSFVALEEKLIPSPDGGPPKKVMVPVPLPESWEYDAVFGRNAYDLLQLAPGARGGIGRGVGGGFGAGSGLVAAPGTVNTSSAIISPLPANKKARRRAANALPPPPPPPPPPAQSTAGANRRVSGGVIAGVVGGIPSGRASSLPPPPLVTREDRTRAVARYLLRNQRVTGVWTDDEKDADAGLRSTAFAVLAYLGEGNTDRAGLYQTQVRRALGTLLDSVNSVDPPNVSNKTRALILFALSEAASATGSERYLSAAQKLAAALIQVRNAEGLWPQGDDSTGTDMDTSAWAMVAIKSAQAAGVKIDGDVFTEAAAAEKVVGPADGAEHSAVLIRILAGHAMSDTERTKLVAQLTKANWKLKSLARVESAAQAVLTLRLLDDPALVEVEATVLGSLAKKQSGKQGSQGGHDLGENRPVAASGRGYFLLVAGKADWLIFRDK